MSSDIKQVPENESSNYQDPTVPDLLAEVERKLSEMDDYSSIVGDERMKDLPNIEEYLWEVFRNDDTFVCSRCDKRFDSKDGGQFEEDGTLCPSCSERYEIFYPHYGAVAVWDKEKKEEIIPDWL